MFGAIIYGIGRLFVFIFKLIGKFIKYTWPLQLIVVLAFGGVLGAYGILGNKYNNWRDKKLDEITHTITIHWGDGETERIEVREDLPFTINGAPAYAAEYGNSIGKNYVYGVTGYLGEHKTLNNINLNPNSINMRTRDGYKLEGFATNVVSGSIIINAAGYGIYDIDEDMELWAIWSEVTK